MTAVNELNSKKIAQLVRRRKKEFITINNLENCYFVDIGKQYYFKLDNEQFQEFKNKYNSYKNTPDIPVIEQYSSISKINGDWDLGNIDIFDIPEYKTARYNGYTVRDYKECNIEINNNIIFNADEIGFVGIPRNILQYYPEKCTKLFYNSKIYIYTNTGLKGIIQSGDHKLYNKEIKMLTESLQENINNIDDSVVNDSKMINGVENVI